MERREPPSLVALLGLGDGAGAPVRHRDELYAMWSAARAEANLAYEAWRDEPGSERYWSYLAAEERADAAQDALAEACQRRHVVGGFRAAA